MQILQHMEASLVKIGNSHGLIIPSRVLKKLGVVRRFNIVEQDGSLIFTPLSEEKPRENWEALFAGAVKSGVGEQDIFGQVNNEFDDSEWTW